MKDEHGQEELTDEEMAQFNQMVEDAKKRVAERRAQQEISSKSGQWQKPKS